MECPQVSGKVRRVSRRLEDPRDTLSFAKTTYVIDFVDFFAGSHETPRMKSFLLLLTALLNSNFKERRDLALENLALRQQLAVLKRERKRPAIKNGDRLFWVW